jgi:hypothetical protein
MSFCQIIRYGEISSHRPKRRWPMQYRIDEQAAPLTVTLATARTMSGLSRSTLLRRADDGKLDTRLVCGRRLVVVASLKKLLGIEQSGEAQAA